MTDSYTYVIVALLPLAASMLVFQDNPYHALVIRGILGAVAALVYTVLGAADVALTEALVGTMLAVTLNAVAVRSSMVLRLGVLETEAIAAEKKFINDDRGDGDGDGGSEGDRPFHQLVVDLRTILRKHHLRLELVPYVDSQDLHRALMEKEVHATCVPSLVLAPTRPDRYSSEDHVLPYHAVTRLRRIYDLLQTGLSCATIDYTTAPQTGEFKS